MSKFEQTFCSQCGGSFGPGDSGYSHCFDHQSPGARKAAAYLWAGMAERRVAEFGLPWHVEPWGDGSKPPYVNILSESHAVVIAADLERDVANWIVSMANAAISPTEAEEPKAEGEMRGIAKNAGLLLAAIYEWLERVEKAGGATGISGVAACHAMLTSLRKNAPRAEKLVLAPLRAALSKSEGK